VQHTELFATFELFELFEFVSNTPSYCWYHSVVCEHDYCWHYMVSGKQVVDKSSTQYFTVLWPYELLNMSAL
jgi:hypothetical protein